MPELLCHLCGDYVLQNHWMANNKVKAWLPAIIHAVLYTLPFLFLTCEPAALGVICGTHVIIDRFRLARYWVEFWGVGNTGDLWWCMSHDRMPWESGYASLRTEYPKERAPDWLAVWLLIPVDNTVHLTINHFALML